MLHWLINKPKMRRLLHSKNGFSVTELFIASLLTLWIFIIVISLYVMTETAWQEASTTLEIQRKANLAMERLLRGFKAVSDSDTRGLLDAKSFTIDDAQSIRFTSGIDSKERRFYLSNGWLFYDPDNLVASDEVQSVGNISNLTFTASPSNPTKVVLISLTVSKAVRGVNKSITLSGAAFLRNE